MGIAIVFTLIGDLWRVILRFAQNDRFALFVPLHIGVIQRRCLGQIDFERIKLHA